MNSKMQTQFPVSMVYAALSIALLVAAPQASAQAASLFRGTITAINGSTLTVKPDAGDIRQVDVPSTAAILRIAPGFRSAIWPPRTVCW